MKTLTIKKRPSRVLRGITFAYDPGDVVVSFKWTDPLTGKTHNIKCNPMPGTYVSVDRSE